MPIYCYILDNTLFVVCKCEQTQLCDVFMAAFTEEPLILIIELNESNNVKLAILHCAYHQVSIKILKESHQLDGSSIYIQLPICNSLL